MLLMKSILRQLPIVRFFFGSGLLCLLFALPGEAFGSPEDVSRAIDEIFAELKVSSRSGDLTACIVEVSTPGSDSLDALLTSLCRSRLVGNSGSELLSDQQTAAALFGLEMTGRDLRSEPSLLRFCEVTGVTHVVFVYAEYLITSVRLHGEAYTAARTRRVSRDIPISPEFRNALGFAPIGALILQGPDFVSWFLDSGPVKNRKGANEGFLLPAKKYRLVAEGIGQRYSRTIDVRTNERTIVQIDTDRPWFAPLGAVITSAVPGLPLGFYAGTRQRAPEVMVTVSATTFYVAGAMWLIDELQSPNFLTRSAKEEFRDTKQIELWITLGSFAMSTLSSLILGIDYVAETQTMDGSVYFESSSRIDGPGESEALEGFGVGDPSLDIGYRIAF